MIVNKDAEDADIVIAYTTLLEDPDADVTGELAPAIKARAFKQAVDVRIRPDHWVRVHTALFNYGISRS